MNNGILQSQYNSPSMPGGLLYRPLRVQSRSSTLIWEASTPTNSVDIIRGSWRPIDIPDCVTWFDATERSSYSISTGISQWRDLSGNNCIISQSTANNQPLLSFMNGKTAFLFDGVNDTLESAGLTNAVSRVLSNAVGMSAYMVTQPFNSYFSWSYHWGPIFGDHPIMITEVFGNRLSLFYRRKYSDASTFQRSSPSSLPVFFRNNIASVVSIRWNAVLGLITASSNSLMQAWPWLDGSNNGNSVPGSFTRGNFGIGGAALRIGQWNSFFNGLLGEFIIYNRALSEHENFTVMYNLMSKWNIQS